MIGAIAIVVVLLLFPIAVFISGAVLAGILGEVLTRDVDGEYEGTEYAKLV